MGGSIPASSIKGMDIRSDMDPGLPPRPPPEPRSGAKFDETFDTQWDSDRRVLILSCNRLLGPTILTILTNKHSVMENAPPRPQRAPKRANSPVEPADEKRPKLALPEPSSDHETVIVSLARARAPVSASTTSAAPEGAAASSMLLVRLLDGLSKPIGQVSIPHHASVAELAKQIEYSLGIPVDLFDPESGEPLRALAGVVQCRPSQAARVYSPSPLSALGTPMLSETSRAVFVKMEGDPSWAEVIIAADVSLARLTEEIVKKLELTERLSTLTLHLWDPRTKVTRTDALDSAMTVAEALPAEPKVRIVVRSQDTPPDPWSDLLMATVSRTDDIRTTADRVARCALVDGGFVEAISGPPSAVLQRPLPLDTSREPILMMEMMEPADGDPSRPALNERVWDQLSLVFGASLQRKSMVLLTGVSGAGKTKVAFDIGRKHAFVVISRVWEKINAYAWERLRRVLDRLHRRMDASNSETAISVMLLLLTCQFEWAIEVYEAARRQGPDLDNRAYREVTVRGQRNGVCQEGVDELFRLRLREMLSSRAKGSMTLPLEPVLRRLSDLRARLPSTEPVIWCYDEVQVLLDCFDGLFEGTFVRETSPHTPESSTKDDERPPAPFDPRRFPSLSEDSQPSPEHERRCGWFYGLLVAIRYIMRDIGGAHLLCGTALRLDRQLLNAHSPAQGMCVCIDADVRLDGPTIKAWFSKYLTPAAAAGLDDYQVGRLAGRPLFASYFFQVLHARLRDSTTHSDPAAVVRDAVREAINAALREAVEKIHLQWNAKFTTSKGEQPQLLIAWLYTMQRMGFGTTTLITPPSASTEVLNAVQAGVLHVGRNDTSINLADEPLTAEAVCIVGDRQTGDWVVRWALARRVSGLFGHSSAKGATAEELLAWILLQRARSPVSLRELFEDFMVDVSLFPDSLADHTVRLTQGLACDIALPEAGQCFLELLADGRLLHRTQETAAGADLVFLVQRPGMTPADPPRDRLVLVQVKNAASASAADMLRTVDLGKWYPDTIPGVETASHRAMRAVLDGHPNWLDPVRVLVSARPWAVTTQHAAAWVNWVAVPQQPVLLTQLTKANLRADIDQEQATRKLNVPRDGDRVWWPTHVRHWTCPRVAIPPPPKSDARTPVSARILVQLRAGATGDNVRDVLALFKVGRSDKNGQSMTIAFANVVEALKFVRFVRASPDSVFREPKFA